VWNEEWVEVVSNGPKEKEGVYIAHIGVFLDGIFGEGFGF
jgi:hypothetical protein